MKTLWGGGGFGHMTATAKSLANLKGVSKIKVGGRMKKAAG